MPGLIPASAVIKPAQPRESPLGLTLRALLRRPPSRIAMIVLGVIILVGLLAPFIAPYDPAAQPDIVALKDLPPSLSHPFGTDPYSRDVLSRVIYGARLSLTIGILATHLLPKLVSPIAVAATLGVAHVIVLEAGLSYLGIGVPQPLASWGNIIQDGADQVARLWWMSLFPGLFMVSTVMMLNILGEALRDVYERRS